MSRLLSPWHQPRSAQYLLVAYAVLRTASAFGQHIATFPDTSGYESFSLAGNSQRLWPVPLLYSIFTDAPTRVIAQILIGIGAWGWCAKVLAQHSRYPRIVMVAVLVMGLTPQVIRYDLALLSESLTISFVVIAITASINLASHRNPQSIILWSLSLMVCGMVRPTHLVIIWICAFFVLIQIMRSRKVKNLGLCLVLVLLSMWGYANFRADHGYSNLNLYSVLAERVMTNDLRYEWFVQHGMPDIPTLRTSLGYDYVKDVDSQLLALIELPIGQQPPSLIRVGGTPFAQWVISDGWRTYYHYVITHRSDTFTRIHSLADPTLSPQSDDFLPIDIRFSFARPLFSSWLLWVMIGAIATATMVVRASRRRHVFALFAMAICVFAVYSITVLSAGIEHPRHASAVAVAIRLLSVSAVVLALPRRRTISMPDAGNAARGKKTAPVD